MVALCMAAHEQLQRKRGASSVFRMPSWDLCERQDVARLVAADRAESCPGAEVMETLLRGSPAMVDLEIGPK
jgi:hypothetical protein